MSRTPEGSCKKRQNGGKRELILFNTSILVSDWLNSTKMALEKLRSQMWPAAGTRKKRPWQER